MNELKEKGYSVFENTRQCIFCGDLFIFRSDSPNLKIMYEWHDHKQDLVAHALACKKENLHTIGDLF